MTTGILGADATWNRLLAGVAVSVSEGEGSFGQLGLDSGIIEGAMTTVNLHARVTVSDRASAWGMAGYGIASTCTISGRSGLLRVEAKAHSKELSSLDTCGAAPVNRKQIENALEEANAGLRRVSGSS